MENLRVFSDQKQVIFPLINQRSNIDGGGPLNRDGGTLNLDGEACPPHPRPPYNLSTGLKSYVF